MNDKGAKTTFKMRSSTLVMLVIFVFIILFISIVLAGLLSHFLMVTDVLPSMFRDRFLMILAFMLIVSLFIGTILAIFGGERFLRPLHILSEATKEIASGNFSVRVNVGSSREIGHLATSFNEMAKGLSSIETLRADFVNNISHEFKTPVSSISGFAKRLKRNNLSNDQRSEYLDIIISESERLTRLSSNVLLLSKLESDEKNAGQTAFYLDEQLRRTILLLEPQLQKKGVEIEVGLEKVEIVANEEMLHHLWINLLGNAIKFSPNGGTVKVALKAEANNAIISISDAGIGMDDETKKHIFDKFYQADQSRATEGNGLGMSLVKRILELESGQIIIDSEPGAGTCLTVILSVSK